MGNTVQGLSFCALGYENLLFHTLDYSDEDIRKKSMFLCKRYTSLLTTESAYRWRLERLHMEYGVYAHLSLEQSSEECPLKTLFLESISKRDLWRNASEEFLEVNPSKKVTLNKDECSFHIKVSVRFRPLRVVDTSKRTKCVTLPLHQKLSMIKIENNVRSNSEALNILKSEGEWFHNAWMNIEKDQCGMNSNHLNLDRNKHEPSMVCGIDSINPNESSVVIIDPTKGLRTFLFDHVFPENCNENAVYIRTVQPLITDFINGMNASCLVYGVTGSGKTHTMFGETGCPGIVPRACEEIFRIISMRTRLNLKFRIEVKITYIEVFGNQISDLLQNGSPCASNSAASQRFVLSGASEVQVKDINDVNRLLTIGEEQKRKAATAMNERSSRAHSLFIITLNQTCENTDVCKVSKLFLVDLGGCEQTKKSNLFSGSSRHFDFLRNPYTMGDSLEHENEIRNCSVGFVKSDRMREAVNINLGLMALKSCVRALVSEKSKYVPFSDSKLTMLLSTGFGGNSKSSVIICASQDHDQFPETVSALKFGEDCLQVKNTVFSESDYLRQVLKNIDEDIIQCENAIKEKERWEVKEQLFFDDLAENCTLESQGLGGIEVRKTAVLSGAEDERQKLDQLLQKRAKVLGTTLDYQKTGRRVGGNIGFGDGYVYNLGKKYSSNEAEANYRFGAVDVDSIPTTVKRVGGKTGWKDDKDHTLSDKEVTRLKIMAKRSKLVYTGISN